MKRRNGEGTVYRRKDGRWCAAYMDNDHKRKYVYGKSKEDAETKLTKAMLKIRPNTPYCHFNGLDEGIPIHIESREYYNYFIFENLIELELIPNYYRDGSKMITLRIKPSLDWMRACEYKVSRSVFTEDYSLFGCQDQHVSATVAGLLVDITISHIFNGLENGCPAMLSIEGIVRSVVPTKEETDRLIAESKSTVIDNLSAISGKLIPKEEFIAFTDDILADLRLLVYNIPPRLKEDCENADVDKWEKVNREFKKRGRALSKSSMDFLREFYEIPFSIKTNNGYYLISHFQ